MSCLCGNNRSYHQPCWCGNNHSCGCLCYSVITTSTTTICPDGEPCVEALDPNCIIYCGPDLPCYGISQGDTAADILNIILEFFGPNCPTTTTSTSTSTTTTSTTTSTSTTTTTTSSAGRTVSCNDTSTYYVGGQTYPTVDEVLLGSDVGTCSLQFNVINQPDRIIVYYDNVVVIDTGYRGFSGYDYGGGSRSSFNASLTGKLDPITGLTYPYMDMVNAPDGYPHVSYPDTDVINFYKNNSLITKAFVEIYAPMSGTGWEYQMNCPVPDPELPCICMAAYNYSTTTSHTIYYKDCDGNPASIPIGFTDGVDNIVNFCTSDSVTSDFNEDIQFYVTFNNCIGGNCPDYNCDCITFTNPSPGDLMNLFWKDCFGRNQFIGVAAASYQTCGSTASSTTPGVTISTGGPCTSSPSTPLNYNC
jgi:hypothetical protein